MSKNWILILDLGSDCKKMADCEKRPKASLIPVLSCHNTMDFHGQHCDGLEANTSGYCLGLPYIPMKRYRSKMKHTPHRSDSEFLPHVG